MRVQRVGREVRSLLQKKGVCIFFFNSQGSSRITALQKDVCVCVCVTACKKPGTRLTPCQPGAYSDVVPEEQEPRLRPQPLLPFVCLCRAAKLWLAPAGQHFALIASDFSILKLLRFSEVTEELYQQAENSRAAWMLLGGILPSPLGAAGPCCREKQPWQKQAACCGSQTD